MTAHTSVSPTARQVWRSVRGLLLAAAIVAAAGVALAAVRSGEHHSALDPRSPSAYGSRATARLLADHGVRTEVVTRNAEAVAAAGPDTTVLVTRPDLLDGQQLSALRRVAEAGGRTVVVGAGAESTPLIAPGASAADASAEVASTEPRCALPAAVNAGAADVGGVRYRVADADAEGCYPRAGLPVLVSLPAGGGGGGGETVLLGGPQPLYNERLDSNGNASLVLQLLGSRTELVWYLPSAADASAADDEAGGLLGLLPDGWYWGGLQLAVAAVLAALWRARRLGPLVPEPLPVAVPAAEATESRARLYHQADARGHAAQALRAATRRRVAPLVGVSAAAADTPDVLVAALSPYQDSDPREVLFGPPPSNDTALVRLADALDDLERRVARAAYPDSQLSADEPTTDKDRSS